MSHPQSHREAIQPNGRKLPAPPRVRRAAAEVGDYPSDNPERSARAPSPEPAASPDPAARPAEPEFAQPDALPQSPATALAELVMRPWLEASEQMMRMWSGMSGTLASVASPGTFPGLPFSGFSHGLAGAPNPMRLLALPLQRQPESDLAECRDCYELSLELAGVAADELEVRCGPGVIMVIGEKREEGETDRLGLALAERRFGRFERTFAMPADADTQAAEAHYHAGVLRVRVPKA
ncbi:MAG: Hsp20 family protein, partial [Hyphomonadaceae bacterium]|nr:Hsp20 family protein [Hyphomonadaceae bacterium]